MAVSGNLGNGGQEAEQGRNLDHGRYFELLWAVLSELNECRGVDGAGKKVGCCNDPDQLQSPNNES